MTFVKIPTLSLILSLGLFTNQSSAAAHYFDDDSKAEARPSSPQEQRAFSYYLPIPHCEWLANQMNARKSSKGKAETLLENLKELLGEEIPHDHEGLVTILRATVVQGALSLQDLEAILLSLNIGLIQQANDPIELSQKNFNSLRQKVSTKASETDKAKAIFNFLKHTEALQERFPDLNDLFLAIEVGIQGSLSLEKILSHLGIVIEDADRGRDEASTSQAPRTTPETGIKPYSKRLDDLNQQQHRQDQIKAMHEEIKASGKDRSDVVKTVKKFRKKALERNPIPASISQDQLTHLNRSIESFIQHALTHGSRRVAHVDVMVTPIVMALNLREPETIAVQKMLSPTLNSINAKNAQDIRNGTCTLQQFYDQELSPLLVETLAAINIHVANLTNDD